jgi:uncharacterized protein involved in exopolysaccharide biosynthesis
VGGVLGCVAAFVFFALAVPQTRVTMLIGPADNQARTDLKALLPDNPSFALQYLVSTMGAQDSSDFARFEQTLRGPMVAAQVVEDPVFEKAFARSGRFVFSRRDKIDGAGDLSERMVKKIRIESVGNTAMRRIIFDHPDGTTGMAILNRLYTETDRMIRADMTMRARERARYLKETLQSEQHPDHRRALTALLMEQEHILMILSMEEPFAAVVAEPPYASIKPVWPRKPVALAGFLLAGMMMGYVAQTARRGRR